MRFLQNLLTVMVLAAFATWFGGFTFYVSVVVPIGTEVLGSSFDQGMVTRRVVIPLNLAATIFAMLASLDSMFTWKREASPWKQIRLGSIMAIVFLYSCLFFLYQRVDAMIDLEEETIVGDYEEFYLFHRLYLWASTFQWIAGWVWLICFAAQPRQRVAADTQSIEGPKAI